MIKAELQGRRLVFTFDEGDDIDPYVVEPLAAKIGRQLGVDYLMGLLDSDANAVDVGEGLILAFGRENYERADEELREEEMGAIIMAAFNWQTAGGMEGVNLALGATTNAAGETGPKAATSHLVSRLGPLLSQISRRMASENPTPTDGTPATSTPPDGAKPGKRPSDRQPKKPHAKKAAKPTLSPNPSADPSTSTSSDS